ADKYFEVRNNIIENEIPSLPSIIQSRKELHLPENSSDSWKFTIYLYHILTELTRLLDVSESSTAQLTTEDFDNLATFIHMCLQLGLEPYLHPDMWKNKCFSTVKRLTDDHSSDESNERLDLGIKVFSQLLLVKELSNYNLVEDTLLTYLAATFSHTRNDSDSLHNQLDRIYERFGEKYFQVLLILKGNQALPMPLQKALHKELMKRLICPNGFEVICKTLIKFGDDADEPTWKKSTAVFDIVGRKGHKREFYLAIIDGIYQFFHKCIKLKELQKYIETCVGSLSRIYSLKMTETSKKIRSQLVERLEDLCQPKEIFAGFVVLDNEEFREVILKMFFSFCGSIHVSMPSEILVPYLRVLCQLFSQMEATDLKSKISALIVQCLHNRERAELQAIINSLLFEETSSNLKAMHSRIDTQTVGTTGTSGEHKCIISKASDSSFFDASECLIQILKASNNNILTYNIFIHLFEQLDGRFLEPKPTQSDLIQDEEELTQLMSKVFRKRVAIYFSLSELINQKQLLFQISENPSEMFNICLNILRNHLTQSQHKTLNDDHSTILVLSVMKEFVEKLRSTDQCHEFVQVLVQMKARTEHNEVENQIDSILAALNHSQEKHFRVCDKSKFAMAKELCEQSSPHLKVYGLMQFIKLIRDEKDKETINNKHAVLAISLICLKDVDSYVFLNCIKLLIVLVDILESVVLEMLIAEYQSAENEIDQRLKIGDVIVKVVEGLGPMSYNYKNILINCFLRESTSNVNEMRLSSLSNLSSICRILSYQIHNFFQEMMIILQSIIQNDNYLPARRAAVMVLTDVINGIDNLIDFQEILLPVYKILLEIAKTEDDRSTRIHAELGLD
ncbi:Transport and Golgi organization protein 6, partial [Pseudolycoriella hygida]